MEDVLEVYQRPRDANRPLVCLDEFCKQLLSEVKTPIDAKPGKTEASRFRIQERGLGNRFSDVRAVGRPQGNLYIAISYKNQS